MPTPAEIKEQVDLEREQIRQGLKQLRDNTANLEAKEYIYKRQHAAEQKILKLMDEQTHEFIVCTHDALHYVGPDDDE